MRNKCCISCMHPASALTCYACHVVIEHHLISAASKYLISHFLRRSKSYSELSAHSFSCMNNYPTSSHQTDMLHVPCDVSFQHTLTSTADLVLDRLTRRVSALTVGSDPESAKAQNTEETDHPAKKEDCVIPTPSN